MPIPALLAGLANAGLGLLGNAILAKGKEVIEDKIGIKIPDDPAKLRDPKVVAELQQAQFAHEEFLVNAALKEKELELDAEKHGQTQVTERWKFDMSSDSWLSKNIRPLALIWVSVNITGMLIAEGFDVEFSAATVGLIQFIAGIIYGAYFLGRSAEKGFSVFNKRKGMTDVARR